VLKEEEQNISKIPNILKQSGKYKESTLLGSTGEVWIKPKDRHLLL
jgi:hypothetical protein